jgi:hypothetical protein
MMQKDGARCYALDQACGPICGLLEFRTDSVSDLVSGSHEVP